MKREVKIHTMNYHDSITLTNKVEPKLEPGYYSPKYISSYLYECDEQQILLKK